MSGHFVREHGNELQKWKHSHASGRSFKDTRLLLTRPQLCTTTRQRHEQDMHRPPQSESLYSMLSRTTEKPAPETALDAGAIDAGTRAVIELNVSDAEAAYHYVSHLMRVATGCSEHFVLRPVPPAQLKREPKTETGTGSASKKSVEKESEFSVLLVDELLLFDVPHYATTVPSAAFLEQAGIIQDPDPFVCLGECRVCRTITCQCPFPCPSLTAPAGGRGHRFPDATATGGADVLRPAGGSGAGRSESLCAASEQRRAGHAARAAVADSQ